VFDINDFDETLPGPFEWDLKRLVASFAVAGRDRGFDEGQRRTIDLGVTAAYREAMAGFAAALVDVMEPKTMEAYGRLCGMTLARAHARSGDAVAIASYLGRSNAFDQALATFAELYADQNERDDEALRAAAASGPSRSSPVSEFVLSA
jgi:uncharacterized protein (DUF2252 family)